MSAETSPQNSQLLPIKVATSLVPYSRDYVTRLARDGRVAGVLIGRQWFVEKDSLLSFYEQSQIEDAIRSRRLSQVRKVELEARACHHTRLKELAAAAGLRRRQNLMQTALILLCGLSTGILIFGVGSATQPQPDTATALVADSVVAPIIPANGTTTSPVWLAESNVTETTDTFSLAGGIVLLPETATNTTQAADFFSDTVTIEMTSTTTGVVRNGQSALPFVRIPETATATVAPVVSNNDTQ